MTKRIYHIGAQLLCSILLITACQKQEYLPPEVGEKVPYTDSITRSLEEGFLQLEQHSLFQQAWLNSGIRTQLLAQNAAEEQYTFLALSDRALTDKGWTTQKIAASSKEALDELLSPYLLQGNVTDGRLRTDLVAVIADSYHLIPDILFRKDAYTGFGSAPDKDNRYYQKVALAVSKEGKLIVNGKSMGTAAPISTSRGTIWPIESFMDFDPRTAWEVLKADGRFSLYTSIIEHTDAAYLKLFFDNNGYYPLGQKDWGIYWMAERYDHNTPRQQGMISYTGDDGLTYIDPLNTWFIPTDEAFRKAGFNTLKDLIQLNETMGAPDTVHIPDQPYEAFAPVGQHPSLYRQPAFVALHGFFATDSLLDYHGNWGMRMKGYAYWQSRRDVLLFTNMLAQELQVGLPLASLSYEAKVGNRKRTLTMTFDSPIAAASNSEVLAPGLDVDRVKISQGDIYTLNGVIHVVDDLFQPTKIK